MPELPDLTVFAKNLNARFAGKTLERIEVVVDKKLNVAAKDLKESLEGIKLEAVVREGKSLQLQFKNDQVLGLHLMLNGEIRLLDEEHQLKFAIIVLHFKGGQGFALTDFQRQATPTLNPEKVTVPDALSKEMDIDYFSTLLSKKRTKIKTLLMDQHALRGIGNSYADEILWAAKISPFSIANAIPPEKVKVLHKAIGTVLHKEIEQISKKLNGSVTGEVRDFLKVHNPHLKESPTGSAIKMEKIGGRKTYYTDEQELFEA